MAAAALATLAWLPATGSVGPSAAPPGCGTPVTCENQRPGNPPSEWDVDGGGDSSIVGFTTAISLDAGSTVGFKVSSPTDDYSMTVYRMGWYQGNGARRVATVKPSAPARNQPDCLQDAATGLVDCGNWRETARWTIPANALSGIYFVRLRRNDTGGQSHILFVVRNDASHADVLFQTSDTTWQAYNAFGGNSFYRGQPAGRAFKLSYNRPFTTRTDVPNGRDFVWANEYPMVRWLERNGYDVTYQSGLDTARAGSRLRNHRVFLSVGHDEYWAGDARANVEAARDAGVSLAFFSGNEMYWKGRWEPSIDGSGTPDRTYVTYKETWANAKIDPSPHWTGTWRDPRFSPPSDGGRPENATTGTMYAVNCCDIALQVPAADGRMRFWRNTPVAHQPPGSTMTLAADTVGYEWDIMPDNGFQPPGLVPLSTTTASVQQYLVDWGSTHVVPGTATHHLTLYRAPSGALVFSAGSVQWSWALDDQHDGATHPAPDVRMQQATVNLLADMGVQPSTRQAQLAAASRSTDTTPPTVTVSSPAPGTSVTGRQAVTVSGTARDTGGVVGSVEVSTDGGARWHPAQGREVWSYQGFTVGTGPSVIRVRATDDSGNRSAPVSPAVSPSCPCALFSSAAPAREGWSDDTSATTLGLRFHTDVAASVVGVRFYKLAGNTGPHVGSLWTTDGRRLAQGTFVGESATGWQTLLFAHPVPVAAGTTYVASYFAPRGHYAAEENWFRGHGLDRPPLHASPDGSGGNGVWAPGDAFPSSRFLATNYGVDVLATPR